jgi:hypothetical protein
MRRHREADLAGSAWWTHEHRGSTRTARVYGHIAAPLIIFLKEGGGE